MPSCMTLPVTRLDASTAFYLSALHPLSYTYRGSSDPYTNAFGPSSSSSPPDFFITQPVSPPHTSSAHISFTSPTRSAVEAFYSAALDAGGQARSAPQLRNAATGYFSAAVEDRDGNCVEAVHYANSAEGEQRAQSVADGSVLDQDRPPPCSLRRDTGTLESMVSSASSALGVARSLASPTAHTITSPSPLSPSSTSTSSVVGAALFGLAAGAAMGFVLSRDSSSPTSTTGPRHTVTTTISSPNTSRSRTGAGRQRYQEYRAESTTVSTTRSRAPSFESHDSEASNVRGWREGREYLALEDRERSEHARGGRGSRTSRASRPESTASRAQESVAYSERRRPRLLEAAPPAPPPPSSFRGLTRSSTHSTRSRSRVGADRSRPPSHSHSQSYSHRESYASEPTKGRDPRGAASSALASASAVSSVVSARRRGSVGSASGGGGSVATVRAAAPPTHTPSPRSRSDSHSRTASRVSRVTEGRESERVGGGGGGGGGSGGSGGSGRSRARRTSEVASATERGRTVIAPLSEANLQRVMRTSALLPVDVSASAPVGRGGGGRGDGSVFEVTAEKRGGRRGAGRFDRFEREVRPDESVSTVDYREWDVESVGVRGRARRF